MSVTRLQMRFKDSNNATVSFTVNPAQKPVDENHVLEQMQRIINTGAFYTWTGGDIVEIVGATLISTETTDLGVEPDTCPECGD